jgi:two-component system sensor histidine kinase KdpD
MPQFTPSSTVHWAQPLWQRHLMAAAVCGLTTAITLPLHHWLDPVNTVMLFLLTVVLIATQLGRGPAVLASFLSVALFDFFYVPPRWSFAVSDAQYLLTLLVMLAVALIIGHLTIGLRQRAEQAQRVAQRSHALYSLAQTLAGALTVEQVAQAARLFAQSQFEAHLVLLAPNDQEELCVIDSLELEPSTLGDTALIVAKTVYSDHKGVASHQIGAEMDAHVVLPLSGSTRLRGVLMVSAPGAVGRQLQGHRPLIEAVASLVAISLERLHFVDVAHRTQLAMSSERLRSSILSALSHDIRTPLTSLYGLADSLTLVQPPLPDQPLEMAVAIRDQAMRLHRMVSNLLDMAQLQSGLDSGQVRLRLEWQPLEEVVGASIQTLGHSLSQHPVQVQLPNSLPLLSIDAVLMERVLGNLLENASKYSPAGTPIHIGASVEGDQAWVTVSNAGAGFPPDKLHQVFDLFERGAPESNVPGVGLGLAICRAIVEAHGGRIEALNPAGGGAAVRFSLPLGTPPTIEPEATIGARA